MSLDGDDLEIDAGDEQRALDILRAYISHDDHRFWELVDHMIAEYDCSRIVRTLVVFFSATLEQKGITDEALEAMNAMVRKHLEQEDEQWLEP